MHARFTIIGAVGLICAACAAPYETEETTSTSAEERMAAYEQREQAARERRQVAAEERAAERIRSTSSRTQAQSLAGLAAPIESGRSAALQRFMDADGMNMCSIRFQDAARILYGEGSLSR